MRKSFKSTEETKVGLSINGNSFVKSGFELVTFIILTEFTEFNVSVINVDVEFVIRTTEELARNRVLSLEDLLSVEFDLGAHSRSQIILVQSGIKITNSEWLDTSTINN